MSILYVCVVVWLLLKPLFHRADTTNRDVSRQHYCLQPVVKKTEEVSELSILSGHCQDLSVRLSVFLSNARIVTKRKKTYAQILISQEISFISIFGQKEWLVGGDHFYLKFWANFKSILAPQLAVMRKKLS